MSRRLLLVEDERGIAEPLVRLLTQEGYAVTLADSCLAARKVAVFDLVILDWALPDGQGIDLLKEWRAKGIAAPVIFLTARHELVDKVLGFEMGADDYVTKPFEPRELVVRVKARLRLPSEPAPARVLRRGELVLDDDRHQVTHRGAAVELTRMEFQLLKLFLQNAGRVFSRDEILNQVWGYEAFPTTRTVDTHVLQLRQKLTSDLIETVRGVGYRLAVQEES